ncbi:Rad52/Rad22 family DNA repair protein [Singulisphaera sp. PoT]|uniref:Rad52/Rad22 family DNA repair protein n=1 Tax=Singulisphaera sp. PoT TaxID=3411797 RepID=UPI003BF4D980
MSNEAIFQRLVAKFEPNEVKARAQGGKQLRYVTARTVMNRLDEVLGPANWWDRYIPGENSVMCRLTIRLADGSTITKMDAGGYAGMADSGDDDKSGFSDAFKRAAVKFGVGRYLYNDGVPEFGPVEEAKPQEPVVPVTRSTEEPYSEASHDDETPRTGKAFFAWVREQEQRYSVGLLKYINEWGKIQEFPNRLIDWDSAQVRHAYGQCLRKLNALQGGNAADVAPTRESVNQQFPSRQEIAKACGEIRTWAGDFVRMANEWWKGKFRDKGKPTPDGHDGVLDHPNQLLNHLLKQAAAERLVTLPEGFKFEPQAVVELIAPLWLQNPGNVEEEAWRYAKVERPAQIRAEVDAAKAKHEMYEEALSN